MCGICGELRFDNTSPDQARIDRMKTKLEQRGPDSEGSYFNNAVGLGHRRLAIIDLSDKAAQPMIDESAGIALVFNGTIYNYPELRKELQAKGHEFKSTGDTEVILRAYAEWGEACLQRLHGMFAFAIWDTNKKELLVARDRVGIKPLYFSQTDQRLLFASNTQALIHADDGIDKNIDAAALHNLFSLHAVVPAPRTILKGIRKVKPAHYMVFKQDGSVEEKRYWTLTAKRPDKKMSEQDWVEAIRNSLKKSVERRVKIADVPVGVLLSGGIDSSLLVGLLAEAGAKDLKTFSVGFEDQPEEKGNEFEYSDAVAEHFNTEHHRFLVPNNQVLPKLPEAFAHMAEPMFGQDAVAFYLLSEVVSKEVKVVQSGQGADEVFGGYFWYPRMHESTTPGVKRFSEQYFDRDHDEYLETVDSRFHGDDVTSQMMGDLLDGIEADEYLDRVLAADVTTLIVDDPVKRVDNMTMAWGLEARVPFLDQELIELAATMPPEMKLPNGGKHVLKEMSRGFLPDSVVNRTKAYFPMPALKYVRGEFLEFMKEILFCDAARNRGLFNPAYVEKLMKNPEDYLTRLQGSKLWHLAALELWLQQNIDS
ncbi:MAG: N-acetylglutaminylglutamine amidotransferase [Gammaproteobacteria bacterium]|nr:N-acetylglutaminylglutamine amidotransferase [Gammaproteobacteria bacterium]MCK5262032.1 N-acetylglutaminylglutamine amidotransferase [Gammaproteobacteria bacterium]